MMDLNQVLSLFTKGPVERRGMFQKVSLLDGGEYLGDIVSGRRHGVGFMQWADGLKYLGEWVDNSASGEGILLWPDGAEYYGQVLGGKRHGRGLYIDVSGHYAGEWRAGLRHGLGTQVSADSTYCGEWVDGARSGWGNVCYASGNHYEGLWTADVMEGYGSMTWITTAKSSKAQQHNAAATGSNSNSLNTTSTSTANLYNTVTSLSLLNEGTTLDMARTITSNVGALAPGPLGPFSPSVASSEAVFEKYVGSWRGGRPHGKGEYALFFHDGAARDNPFQTINHFVGNFRDGKRHGNGTQLYADGRVFEGEWAENIKTGHGVLTLADGTRSSVIVRDDVIVPEKTAPNSASSSSNPSPQPSSRGRTADSSRGNNNNNINTNTTTNAAAVSTNAAATGNSSGNGGNNGVFKDINTSSEDALQISDLASEKEVSDVKGVVTNYKPQLKHLYTIYATIPAGLGYYSAIEQFLSSEEDVPNPAFLSHPVAASVPPLQGVSRDKRNKRLCQKTCEIIHSRTVRDANGIAKRFSRAAEAMGEGSAFGKGLTVVEKQQSLADEAFMATYASPDGLALIGGPAATQRQHHQNVFRSRIDIAMPMNSSKSDRKALQNTLTRSQFLQMLDDARVLDTALPPSRVNFVIAAALARDPNRTITPPKQMRAMLRPIDKASDQMSFGVFVEALVRVAEARIISEGPWLASCVLNNLSLTHRIQLFCDYYIIPLSNALQGMAANDTLKCLGIEPFFATSSGNQTIVEMKRNAARALQVSREKARGGAVMAAGGGAAGQSIGGGGGKPHHQLLSLPTAQPSAVSSSAPSPSNAGLAAPFSNNSIASGGAASIAANVSVSTASAASHHSPQSHLVRSSSHVTGAMFGGGGGGEDEVSLANALDDTTASAANLAFVSTIVKRQPIKVDGTPNAALQLWTVECLDLSTHRVARHCLVVHAAEGDYNSLSFGRVIMQRTREDYFECLHLLLSRHSRAVNSTNTPPLRKRKPTAIAVPFVMAIGGSPTCVGLGDNTYSSASLLDNGGGANESYTAMNNNNNNNTASSGGGSSTMHQPLLLSAAYSNGVGTTVLLGGPPSPSASSIDSTPQQLKVLGVEQQAGGDGDEDTALYPIHVGAEVLTRVPCVAQQIERNLLLLIRIFESLQRDIKGVCRLSDVFNVLLLSGFIKSRTKRIVTTVIPNKPKPTPPPANGKEKGKPGAAGSGVGQKGANAAGGSSAAAGERRRSSSGSKMVAAAASAGKMNKKQLQLQQALEAEAALQKREEEQAKQRLEVLKRADELLPADSLDPLPAAEVPSMDELFRCVLLSAYHMVLGDGVISAFPHRVSFDPTSAAAAASDANSAATRQFCKVSPMLEEVMHLQRMSVRDMGERAAKARPVSTPAGTTQPLLIGDTVLLSFNDFISVLIHIFLSAYGSRTPLQAIKAGFLFLPKMHSVMTTYRNVAGTMPPFVDSDVPLPVRFMPAPEDPKAKKK